LLVALSPISDTGIAAKKLELLRDLEAVGNAWSKFNARLTTAGQEPLARLFYSATEVDALKAQHKRTLARAQPKKEEPRKYHWLARGVMSPRPGRTARETFGGLLPGEDDEDEDLAPLDHVLAVTQVIVAAFRDNLGFHLSFLDPKRAAHDFNEGHERRRAAAKEDKGSTIGVSSSEARLARQTAP
jgi:hypothetical protein